MLRRLVDRYLDPSESLLEILFGLIMALTMTAGARLVADPATLHAGELMAAPAGWNVAAGFHDAGVLRESGPAATSLGASSMRCSIWSAGCSTATGASSWYAACRRPGRRARP